LTDKKRCLLCFSFFFFSLCIYLSIYRLRWNP